jgi:inosine-uridine nucleoside N-ribohydrolase
MSLPRAIVIALVLATLAGCVDDAPSTAPSIAPSTAPATATVPVVLDYSPTHSDIGALLYLASHPDVDLLAVTLPGTGEADCAPGTRNTRQLLAVAGLPDVPVGCGRDEPLKGHRDWPEEWRTEANTLPRVLVPPVAPRPVLDAEVLLADVLGAADARVTVVAVGPLTNLAVTLTEHPELASRIERVVIMGGAVDVEGNVPDIPSAEWNLYVDPEAARIVVGSGVPVLLVPLDATNDVPFGRDVVLRLSLLGTPTGRAEYQRLSAQTWFDGAFMWDELTAVAAMRPDTVTIERRRLVVDADGATLARGDGSVVDVAVAADAAAFDEEFRRVLNGGSLPPTPSLTAEEAAYLDTLSASLRRAGDQAEAAFTARMEEDAYARATGFITATVDAVTAIEDDTRQLEAPAELADPMRRLYATIDTMQAAERDLLDAVPHDADADVWDLLGNVFEQVAPEATMEDLFAICAEIDDFSVLRGGPEVYVTR